MNKNFNITIVITRDDFYRNFYKTEAFKDLDNEFNVSYVLSDNSPKEETKRKVFYFQKKHMVRIVSNHILLQEKLSKMFIK